MNKTLLSTSILASAVLLGAFHYVIKPKPDENAIRQFADDLNSSTEWRGQTAPDFEVQTTHGEKFQLAENVGKKVIVLNFFATWCGPCREEMPELNRYFNEHKNGQFLLLGIDAEEKKDTVDAFVSDMKIDFPVAIDAGSIQQQYGVGSYPTTVVIGVDGKVQFYETGELANAEVAFDNLLGQNRKSLHAGQIISAEEYSLASQKQPQLPKTKAQEDTSEPKLDPRAEKIAERMSCPCGCEKNVQRCSCATSDKIKKALATEDYRQKTDDDVIRDLNKRFCVGAM
jgi:thiol-disulfide isomerase/thioredoxin